MADFDQSKIDKIQDAVQQLAISTTALTERAKGTDEKFSMLMDTVKESSQAVRELTEKVNGTAGLKEEITEIKLQFKEFVGELGKYRHDVGELKNSSGPLLIQHSSDIGDIKNRVTALETALNLAKGGAVVVEKGVSMFWAVFGGAILAIGGYLVNKFMTGHDEF